MIELTNRVTIALWMRLRREEGQTFVEYAVLTAVVAIGIVAALGLFRGQIAAALSNIGNAIP
jgi:Flp pilus assembly pilin Flp